MLLRRTLICIILAVQIVFPVRGEAPMELFRLEYQEIAPAVLKDAIGVLTLSSETAASLVTYAPGSGGMTTGGKLKVSGETLPISNFGYPSLIERGEISAFRYPIVAQAGNFLRIVYDPRKNARAWVSEKDLKQFYYTVNIFQQINPAKEIYIDPFFLTGNRTRKLYDQPNEGAGYKMLSQVKDEYSVVRVLAVKSGFFRIGAIHFDPETMEISYKPLGWIKIRDEQGLLTVWIVDIDLC